MDKKDECHICLAKQPLISMFAHGFSPLAPTLQAWLEILLPEDALRQTADSLTQYRNVHRPVKGKYARKI